MYTITQSYLSTLVLTSLLAACSGDGGGGSTPATQNSPGMLSKATNHAEFEAAVKQGLRAQMANPAATEALVNADAGSGQPVFTPGNGAPRFTRTYTLETNVDEADVVKYTGDLLLVARRGIAPWRLASDVAHAEQAPASVDIYAANAASASVTPLANIGLGGGMVVTGMFVDAAATLAVLGTSLQLPIYGDIWSAPGAWINGETVISLHNLQDPTQPQQRWRAEFDGSLIESRRVGDTLYLISRFTPYIEGVNYSYIEDEAGRVNNRQLIDAAPIEGLLPKLRINGNEEALVQPANCYVPSANSPAESLPNGSITTITAIPLATPWQFKSACYTGNAQGVYMSAQAIYMVEQIYAYSEEQYAESTLVHKFALSDTAAAYRGSAQLAGVMGGRHSMDFRLSEHDGYLRVITSEYEYADAIPSPLASADRVDHKLTVLRESDAAQALKVVSTLPNDAQPQEIGKPNELLYGVRFSGDQAYLVTFEQVDPLYVLDLADPSQPRIAGELAVPGFADFIHPVSADLILTLGKDANPGEQGWTFVDGMKVELFDVSDINLPQSISRLSIGGRGTDSEALYDRHAFTYAQISDSLHRFAIPIDVFANSGSQEAPQWLSSGLHLFEVIGVDTAEAAAVVHHGELITQAADAGDEPRYYSAERRSVLHNDAVFFVDPQGVWSTFWSTNDIVQGPVSGNRQ